MFESTGTVRTRETIHRRVYRLLLLHPVRLIRRLLAEHATPRSLGAAAALGIVVGSLPFLGLHTLLVYVLAKRLRLNRIVALGTNQLCMPPIVPALCIEAGYYLRHGVFFTEISMRTLGREAVHRLWEWTIGACVVGPALGVFFGGGIWLLAALLQRRPLRGIAVVCLDGARPEDSEEAAPAGQPRTAGTASPAPAPVTGTTPVARISAPRQS